MPETRVVAKVFVCNPQGELLLLQRGEDDVRRPLEWDIPGGHTDGTEFAEEAAARETREEAGITVDARQLRLLSTRTTMVSPQLSVHWLFYTITTEATEIVLSDEHVAFRWVAPEIALADITYDVQHTALSYALDNHLLS